MLRELPEAAESITHIEAIRIGRLLLDSSDPATPQRAKLADVLRRGLSSAQQNHEATFTSGMAELFSPRGLDESRRMHADNDAAGRSLCTTSPKF